MRYPKVYAALAVAAAATVGASAWTWAGPADKSEPQKNEAGGTRVTEPLRAEHRELFPHIEALADAGDAIGTTPLQEQRDKVHASYTFLSQQLIPHAVAEDKVLYAKVDSLIGRNGNTRATDTMRRDHTEVATLTDKLGELGGTLHEGAPSPAQERELRRILYSLNGIVGLHFAKEEEVFLPLLDRKLSAAQARQMFEQMEKVAEETGGEGGHQH
ncbi:hemerythrin domain-containing protein [Streptomyces sp. HUAS TT20]|uniref:hemerythrin domain-containing protein n=1 Tax=Streptomyces sp. HUAS TT20 TaxID=3447509 RepID=UPI0021DA4A8D|nr:hemerythrin domain-containing protein [Streptomyces sp. HUAS 15-9]UXY32224.1 hemerythrin domain-containing protein [Streptomyces sp. HUAS 15-9]